MASLLPSYAHPSIFYRIHNALPLASPRLLSISPKISSRWNPKISHFPPPASKTRKNSTDRSPDEDDEAVVEPSASSDLPTDDDEWGNEGGSGESEGVTVITDEWGEKTELEPELPANPDPPGDEDEWGNDIPTPAVKLGELKRCLVDTFYGTELGLRASTEARAEIFEFVAQLEAQNPTPAPIEAPELLDGNWILLYTAFSELLPLLAVGSTPVLKIEKISQSIDSKKQTIVNATTLSSPLATFSFSATASFEVQSPSRIQVQFKEGAFQPPEVSSTINLPEKLEILGQKVDLQPVQQLLNPIQQAVANIARGISGQSPLKIQFPGNRAKSWLLTTYLDEDFRISRGDGGLFVLAKEGSPLLDQLS